MVAGDPRRGQRGDAQRSRQRLVTDLRRRQRIRPMVDESIVSGGDDDTVRRLDRDGNELWAYSAHTDRVTGVAFDSDDRVHTCSWDETAAKLDSDGNELWRASFATGGSGLNSVAVAPDGTIRLGGAPAEVRKLASDGSLLWTHTLHDDGVNGVAVDDDGNAYSGDAAGKVIKADSDGNQVWVADLAADPVNDVAVAGDGSAVWVASSDWNVYRLDGDGAVVWTFTSPVEASVNGIAADAAGNAYSIEGFPDYTVRKLDNDGAQVWAFTGHTGQGEDVAVTGAGNTVSGAWDNAVRKVSGGSQLWSFTGHTSGVLAVAAR